MNVLPRIYADFQKLNNDGYLVLTCKGSLDDLRDQRNNLVDGLRVTFYSDDVDDRGFPDELRVEGNIRYDCENELWIGEYRENEIFHVSDLNS